MWTIRKTKIQVRAHVCVRARACVYHTIIEKVFSWCYARQHKNEKTWWILKGEKKNRNMWMTGGVCVPPPLNLRLGFRKKSLMRNRALATSRKMRPCFKFLHERGLKWYWFDGWWKSYMCKKVKNWTLFDIITCYVYVFP